MVGELAGVTAALCWAIGSILFERLGRSGSSPWATNLAKCLFGAFVLLAARVILVGGALPVGASPVDLGLLGVSAVVGLTIGDTAFFGALGELGAPRAVLLLSTAPIFAVLIECGLRRALPPGRELIGVGLTLAGVGIVVGQKARGPDAGPVSPRGIALGLVAGVAQAVGSLLSRAATREGIDPLGASWFRLAIGSGALILVGLVAGQLPGWWRQLTAPGVLARTAAASSIGTVFGLFLSQVALARSSSAGVASTLLATSPIFALPLAHLLGTERGTWRSALGILVAFAGIARLTLG
jgi:drug/metabolite transporter (DMT)-like permease